MDGSTVQAARGRLATEARGSVVLRGQSLPVELHALLGEAGMSPWAQHPAPPEGPLIGRDEELAVLRAALLRCIETGTGSTVVVVGEAGVGKSRLLAAMEPVARNHGFAWTWTENVSYGRGEPYRYARLFAQAVADEQGVDSGALARQLLFDEATDEATMRRYGGAIAAIARDAAFSGWEAEEPDMPSDPAEVTATLLEIARTVKSNRQTYVDVLAHTDTTGTPAVNQSLSDKRASAVASYLSRHGVARARIASKGFGETQPLYPVDTTETQRAANRRVEIRLVPFRSTDAPPAPARRKRR